MRIVLVQYVEALVYHRQTNLKNVMEHSEGYPVVVVYYDICKINNINCKAFSKCLFEYVSTISVVRKYHRTVFPYY